MAVSKSITSALQSHLYSVWSEHCLPIVYTAMLLLPVLHALCKKFNQRSARSPSPTESDLGNVYTQLVPPATLFIKGFTYLPCQYWPCPGVWTSSGSSC